MPSLANDEKSGFVTSKFDFAWLSLEFEAVMTPPFDNASWLNPAYSGMVVQIASKISPAVAYSNPVLPIDLASPQKTSQPASSSNLGSLILLTN